jgi:hypothetical protein
MIRLHTSMKDLDGTAYFELLPGPYRGECWGPNSVFLDEEAFGLIEPIFVRLCPKYDHYAFTDIGRPLWRDILTELDALAAVLDDTPTDRELSSRLGFFFRDTERKFFENRTASIVELREMLLGLTSWIRIQLNENSVI